MLSPLYKTRFIYNKNIYEHCKTLIKDSINKLTEKFSIERNKIPDPNFFSIKNNKYDYSIDNSEDKNNKENNDPTTYTYGIFVTISFIFLSSYIYKKIK